MAREMELKFRLEEEQYRRILEDHPGFSPIAMETVYYDTPDQRLSAANRTFRRRLENGQPVYTLKTPLPDGSRGEWELIADSLEEALPELCLQSGDPILSTLEKDALVPLCGARFTRLAAALAFPGGEAELALDKGILLGGGKEIPLLEAELELKSGSDEALLEYGKAFRLRYRLQPEQRSKFARARALAQ